MLASAAVDARALARNQALTRVAFGVLQVALPGKAMAGWVGAVAERGDATVITRALGAREIGLGLGQLAALRAGHGVRPWLLACIVADGVDLAASVGARDQIPATGWIGVSAIAASAVAVGAYAARELD
jgi:hypothetical protein